MLVLVGQVLVRDEGGVLDEAREVGARAGKAVEDVHPPVAEMLAELPLKGPLHHVELGVHHLHGRVHDAQLLGGALEGRGKEVVVELLDEVLLGGVALHLGGDDTHLGVEVVELGAVQRRPEARVVEGRQGAVDAGHDGVALAHLVLVEQGVEDGPGHLVLGQHVHGAVRVVVGVQGVPETGEESVKGVGRLARLGHEGANLVSPGPGDGADIARPLVPVDLGAALAHDLGADGAGHLLEGVLVLAQEELPLVGVHLAALELLGGRGLVVFVAGVLPHPVSAVRDVLGPVEAGGVEHLELDDLLEGLGVAQGGGVDLGVQALVVGAQGRDHIPDAAVLAAGREGLAGVAAVRHEDGDDDVAVALARRRAHDAPDGLDDVHLAATLGEVDDGVEGWHVDALGEAACV